MYPMYEYIPYNLYPIHISVLSITHKKLMKNPESTRPSHRFLVHQAAMFSSNGSSERSNMCDEKSGSL